MQKHENAVSCEFFHFSGYSKFVKRLESCLTLIVFYHVTLRHKLGLRVTIYDTMRITYTFESHPCVDLVNLDCKFVFDALNLKKPRKEMQVLMQNVPKKVSKPRTVRSCRILLNWLQTQWYLLFSRHRFLSSWRVCCKTEYGRICSGFGSCMIYRDYIIYGHKKVIQKTCRCQS